MPSGMKVGGSATPPSRPSRPVVTMETWKVEPNRTARLFVRTPMTMHGEDDRFGANPIAGRPALPLRFGVMFSPGSTVVGIGMFPGAEKLMSAPDDTPVEASFHLPRWVPIVAWFAMPWYSVTGRGLLCRRWMT